MNTNKKILKIVFDNQKALEEFAHWLCGSGEQEYWTWMDCQEPELERTIVTFDYFQETEEFCKDNTILAPCKQKQKNRFKTNKNNNIAEIKLPTTTSAGYIWYIKETLPEEVELIPTTDVQEETNKNIVDSSIQILSFKINKPGVYKIILANKKLFEDWDNYTETFILEREE